MTHTWGQKAIRFYDLDGCYCNFKHYRFIYNGDLIVYTSKLNGYDKDRLIILVDSIHWNCSVNFQYNPLFFYSPKSRLNSADSFLSFRFLYFHCF